MREGGGHHAVILVRLAGCLDLQAVLHDGLQFNRQHDRADLEQSERKRVARLVHDRGFILSTCFPVITVARSRRVLTVIQIPARVAEEIV